jgi:hypothetical protein
MEFFTSRLAHCKSLWSRWARDLPCGVKPSGKVMADNPGVTVSIKKQLTDALITG